MKSNPTYDLIAACAFGLEAVVRRELSSLGIESTIGESGRVHFRGTMETICRANLWLRAADRVLIRITEFPAADFDALFDTTRDIEWGELIPVDGKFNVTGRSIKSTLTSVPANQRAVKKAMVDVLRRDHNTEVLPETGAEYKIDIALLKDIATLTLDTTGRSLHRRGYRIHISKAPLKETLAAAMVMLSFWKRDKPLLDPFCGSGTIPIEAAMIGRNIAPGRNREFVCETWPTTDAQIFADARAAADDARLEPLEERIIGSDIDQRILKAARENAERAGVEEDIHFQAGSMADVSSKKRFGCLITNPPYGQRIGRDHDLDLLYQTMPDVFRKLPTWSHFILTAFPDFERTIGRNADRRRKLYNGRIECTYYNFHGPKPVTTKSESETETPYVHAAGEAAFGTLDKKAAHQAELFAVRLKKRAKHLRRWPTKRGITCMRIYERDVPEIPLVVDRYENALHITEYERPHDRDPAGHGNWLDLMAMTAGEALEIPKSNVYLKSRLRQRGNTQHLKVADTKQRIVVSEGGLKFLVNLADYVDTGLFLDHRVARGMVRDEASGKTFLNLFAYTGSFTVYAADGGAKSTTTVDLSRAYLDWAEDNMKLNGFVGPQHQYIASDVGEFISNHRQQETYDLVVVDPPTFSNSKRTERDFNVQEDAVPMLNNLLPLVRGGGVIYFSNNFRRFKFDEPAINATEVHEISKQTVPEDFRNRRIHRCWRIVK
jgi:23S rRNA (guanine2445-N2)-methyltransferase / 23S rRNA (guanine2069-N7)-methyltransferase